MRSCPNQTRSIWFLLNAFAAWINFHACCQRISWSVPVSTRMQATWHRGWWSWFTSGGGCGDNVKGGKGPETCGTSLGKHAQTKTSSSQLVYQNWSPFVRFQTSASVVSLASPTRPEAAAGVEIPISKFAAANRDLQTNKLVHLNPQHLNGFGKVQTSLSSEAQGTPLDWMRYYQSTFQGKPSLNLEWAIWISFQKPISKATSNQTNSDVVQLLDSYITLNS